MEKVNKNLQLINLLGQGQNMHDKMIPTDFRQQKKGALLEPL